MIISVPCCLKCDLQVQSQFVQSKEKLLMIQEMDYLAYLCHCTNITYLTNKFIKTMFRTDHLCSFPQTM